MTIHLAADEEERARELARRASAWVQSPEGRAAMIEAAEKAQKQCEEWREASRVDWRTLHTPVTI